jgi:hypothetical protein
MNTPVWPARTPQPPEPGDPLTPNPYDDITPNRASALLRLGLPNARNAADDLVDQLESSSGHLWAAEVTSDTPFRSVSMNITQLLDGTASLATITTLKDAGKDLVKTSATRDVYLRGLAAYYLGIASALAGHKSAITRTPIAELSQILIELASASPPAWRALFLQAAKNASAPF